MTPVTACHAFKTKNGKNASKKNEKKAKKRVLMIHPDKSKLPKEYKFLDLSDYGRPIARVIANSLKQTSYTPIDVTIWFIISGLIAILCILLGYFWSAAFFLIFITHWQERIGFPG